MKTNKYDFVLHPLSNGKLALVNEKSGEVVGQFKTEKEAQEKQKELLFAEAVERIREEEAMKTLRPFLVSLLYACMYDYARLASMDDEALKQFTIDSQGQWREHEKQIEERDEKVLQEYMAESAFHEAKSGTVH